MTLQGGYHVNCGGIIVLLIFLPEYEVSLSCCGENMEGFIYDIFAGEKY